MSEENYAGTPESAKTVGITPKEKQTYTISEPTFTASQVRRIIKTLEDERGCENVGGFGYHEALEDVLIAFRDTIFADESPLSQVQETIRKDREWSCVLIREELSGFVDSEELDALLNRIRNATIGDE